MDLRQRHFIGAALTQESIAWQGWQGWLKRVDFRKSVGSRGAR